MGTVSAAQWVTLAACLGQLALACVALVRLLSAGRDASPLALPLGLLALDLFAMNAADVGGRLAEGPEWIWLDSVTASLLAPLALQFVLAFTGRRRALRLPLLAAWTWYGTLALVSATAFLGLRDAQEFAGSPAWALSLGVGAAALIPLATRDLLLHLRACPPERLRTLLVLGAFTLGAVGNVFDLLANVGLGAPRLGPFGTLLSTLVLTALVLRNGLLSPHLPWLLAAGAAAASLLLALVHLLAFRWLGGDATLFIVAGATSALAFVPALVAIASTAATRRRLLDRQATLGQFSAQMAHDLRNPLAAIRGAAQLLLEQRSRPAPPPSTGPDYLQLILDQAARMERVIADYQRLGRLEPRRSPQDLNALVERVLCAQALAAPEGVTVTRELQPGLPHVPLDPDLVAVALENLVRNAFEAMPSGGAVTLSTEAGGGGGFVRLSVKDTGRGMDARVAERAFDAFFTTRAAGSGLGLPFVRRVAEAHGGDACLQSVEGQGTTVHLRLPC